jgi:6-pyruvoyltetrahydropterin/6-carboxytetrahydropterin synthase
MMFEPLHPHDFTVRITLEGEVNEEGFICDFRAVKRLFNRLVASELNGRNLDEVFEFATSENLAVWIWERLTPYFPLFSIEVREKPHSAAVYFGPASGGESERR